MHFNIFLLFIIDTTSILKLVFPTVYCFCLDGYFGGFVVAIVFTVVFIYLFTYLFIYSFCRFDDILIFVAVVVIATVAFVVGGIVAFCVC